MQIHNSHNSTKINTHSNRLLEECNNPWEECISQWAVCSNLWEECNHQWVACNHKWVVCQDKHQCMEECSLKWDNLWEVVWECQVNKLQICMVNSHQWVEWVSNLCTVNNQCKDNLRWECQVCNKINSANHLWAEDIIWVAMVKEATVNECQ